jgi:hypothetical protein
MSTNDPPCTESTDISASPRSADQQNSRCYLLTLPTELRNQIYKYMHYRALRTDSSMKRILICHWDQCEYLCRNYSSRKVSSIEGEQFDHLTLYCDMSFDIVPPEGTGFNLLLCCKQIYQEAQNLLYDVNTFRLGIALSHYATPTTHYQLLSLSTWESKAQQGIQTLMDSSEIDDLWLIWSRIRHIDVHVSHQNENSENDPWDSCLAIFVRFLNAQSLITVHDIEMPLEANGPVLGLKSQRAAPFELENLTSKALSMFLHMSMSLN